MHRPAAAEHHHHRSDPQLGPSQRHDDQNSPGTTPGTTPVTAPAGTKPASGHDRGVVSATSRSSADAFASEPTGGRLLVDPRTAPLPTLEHPPAPSALQPPRTTRTASTSTRSTTPSLDRTNRPAELKTPTNTNSAREPVNATQKSEKLSHTDASAMQDTASAVTRHCGVSRDPPHRTRRTRTRSR
jgi:hypothetical protein